MNTIKSESTVEYRCRYVKVLYPVLMAKGEKSIRMSQLEVNYCEISLGKQGNCGTATADWCSGENAGANNKMRRETWFSFIFPVVCDTSGGMVHILCLGLLIKSTNTVM